MLCHIANKIQSLMSQVLVGGVLEISWEVLYNLQLLKLTSILFASLNHQAEDMDHLDHNLAVIFHIKHKEILELVNQIDACEIYN